MTVAERTGPPAGADPETGSRVDAGRRRPAKTKDRSRLARRRVAVRLAYRQVRRTWASSLLIVLLIALPIAGMAGVAVFVDSSTATPEDRLTVQLGQMEAWVQPMGVPDAGFWQAPDDPWWNGYPITADGSWQEPEGEPLDDPTEALPAGTETVALSEGNARIETASGIGAVWGWGGAAWDERFTGRFEMLDGRAPQSGDEVLVTPATLDRAGTAIGGTITDADSGEAFTVTGTVDVATLADSESGVVFFDSDRFGQPRWYLPEWAPTWTEIQQLNDQGVAVYAREVVLDPPPFEVDGMQMGTYDPRASMMLALASGLGVGGAFAAYMVIMLAGAAFAVSARRQQRALAIAASVGADARDLRRTIRLQGTVLGAVGGVLGVAAGIGLAALVMQVTANGAATQFWGFHVPWLVLAGVLVFAVLVGTASAVMPARTVAKTDAISALRGARRPQKVQASRPLWGSLMILVGIALTIVSGVLAAAVAGNNEIPYDSPLRWLPFVGIVAGPVLAQLGIVLSGRWLLWLASRVLSRVGIAARIASRDAVANGSRTVPAFAAIGATVFVGVFAMGLGSMITAQTARNWTYGAPVGTAWVTSYSTAQDGTALNATDAADAAASADRALSEAGATATARVLRQVENWGLENEAEVPADSSRAVAVTPERELLDPEVDGYGSMSELDNPRNNIIVLAADDIETVTGIELGPEQLDAYRNGAALVTGQKLVTDGRIEVAAWTERQWMFGGAPDNIFHPWPDAEIEDPQWTETLDAIVVDAPQQAVHVALAPATARDLGISAQPWAVFGAFAEPPTTEQTDRLYALAQSGSTATYSLGATIENGPSGTEAWLVPLMLGVGGLVLGASAVALGLARFERRPDDATLSAVGGTASLRRRIGFWQGLVIAGFGTFAGAAAGILPPLGFALQSQTDSRGPLEMADFPWVPLVILAIGLPLLIAVVNWLVPPRRPELTRRTAIA